MVKNYFKLIVALIFATNVMAQNIPSYVPKDGLVGWWPFNGNAKDESGNGNNGTVNGATLTKDRFGNAGSAYAFDGLSDNISISDDPSLNLSNNLTLSAWFYEDIVKIEQPLLGKGRNDNQTGYTILHRVTQSNDASGMSLVNNSVYNEIFTTQQPLFSLGIWHQIVGTYDGNIGKLYIDGILVNTVSNQMSLVYNMSTSLYFGHEVEAGHTRYFKGSLDDIAIYNRALSDQEVKQLYEGCTKETATSSSFNSVVYTTNNPVYLSANPTGGTFSGEAVTNNTFEPTKAKLGKNQVKYNFKNSTGCADSTNFSMILVDTLGNKCSSYDTILKINFKLTTGIKAGQLTSMNVYPNPASEVLIIEANDIQALSGYRYKILDLQGKEVYNTLATTVKTEISLKSIGAKGMYILHIVDEKGVSIENKKIVLE